jgi:hypothetical protein
MRIHPLFGAQRPNKDGAGPARSSTQPSSTIPWGATPGAYQAQNLKSKEVQIDVAGAGSAIVNVSEKLDAEISGVASVEYIGDPTIKQDVIGAGRVSKHQ